MDVNWPAIQTTTCSIYRSGEFFANCSETDRIFISEEKALNCMLRFFLKINKKKSPEKVSANHENGHDVDLVSNHVEHKKCHRNALEVFQRDVPVPFFQQCGVRALLK